MGGRAGLGLLWGEMPRQSSHGKTVTKSVHPQFWRPRWRDRAEAERGSNPTRRTLCIACSIDSLNELHEAKARFRSFNILILGPQVSGIRPPMSRGVSAACCCPLLGSLAERRAYSGPKN